ncbi:hypothetical protein IWQ51_001505 [Labrenzia sp. EL_142]|nr:hypothetical protein [Labrenzia sp. EL_142]
MTLIIALAEQVSNEWEKSGFACAALPSIAARHLSGDLGFDITDIINTIAKSSDLPNQRRADQNFGQPGVTLFSDERFEIEVLFWHTATPAIHEHGFAGAFRLLSGRSVHCRYGFDVKDKHDGVITGQLNRRDITLLHPGQGIEIPRGEALIHSVFHVDNPSVSLVLRTHQSGTRELTYLPPGVAYDTRARSAALHKRLQLLDMLATTGHPKYAQTMETLLGRGSLNDALAGLIRVGGHNVDNAQFAAAEDIVRARFADFAGLPTVIAGAREERRRCQLVLQRHVMEKPESRIFLAMLLGCETREQLIAAAEKHCHDRASALGFIASSSAELIGGDDTRRIIVEKAVRTRLEERDSAAFLCAVSAISSEPISDDQTETLLRLDAAVAEHPFLGPVFQREGRAA